jgi:hypothetical protein
VKRPTGSDDIADRSGLKIIIFTDTEEFEKSSGFSTPIIFDSNVIRRDRYDRAIKI